MSPPPVTLGAYVVLSLIPVVGIAALATMPAPAWVLTVTAAVWLVAFAIAPREDREG